MFFLKRPLILWHILNCTFGFWGFHGSIFWDNPKCIDSATWCVIPAWPWWAGNPQNQRSKSPTEIEKNAEQSFQDGLLMVFTSYFYKFFFFCEVLLYIHIQYNIYIYSYAYLYIYIDMLYLRIWVKRWHASLKRIHSSAQITTTYGEVVRSVKLCCFGWFISHSFKLKSIRVLPLALEASKKSWRKRFANEIPFIRFKSINLPIEPKFGG